MSGSIRCSARFHQGLRGRAPARPARGADLRLTLEIGAADGQKSIAETVRAPGKRDRMHQQVEPVPFPSAANTDAIRASLFTS